jgi:GNAT superfamily N-acetyltransferase
MACLLRKGDLRDIHEIYRRSMKKEFHRFERMPEWLALGASARGAQELLLLSNEQGLDVGYLFCVKNSLYGYVLINYLAIFPEYRGGGYGGIALELAADYYSDRQGLIVELTNTPGEEEDTWRRQRFYSRWGFEEIPSDYKLGGVETFLMVKPLRGPAQIGSIAHLVIPEIYRTVAPDFMVRRAVEIQPVEKSK